MRKTRIGALIASGALASSVVLGGVPAANASVEGLISSVDVFGSLEGPVEREVVESNEIEGLSQDDEPRYTLTATGYNNCTVDFTLTDDWPGEYVPNFRADYRVGEEDAVMPGSSRGGPTYRPVVGSNQEIADAIENREHPYDFAANEATVDLTEPRTVPQYDNPNLVTELPGVEPNETGTHVITFGVYQGPDTASHGYYSFNETVTVTGCPIEEADDGLLGSLTGLS